MDITGVSGDGLRASVGQLQHPVGEVTGRQPRTHAAIGRWFAPPGRAHVTLYGPIVLSLCATIWWLMSLQGVSVQRMNDLGLISVIPVPTFIAMAMITASFCLLLQRRPLNHPALLLQVLILIAMLYGIPMLLEQEPHLFVPWRHVGIAEYILRTGHVAPTLTAYYDWPGFFVLSAFITSIAGSASTFSLLNWAPVYFNVLYLGPLLMMLNAATRDKRLVWLGVWFFYLTNWVSQDYFSQQAFDYFLNLVILGLLLRYFGMHAGETPPGARVDWPQSRRGILAPIASTVAKAINWLTPVEGSRTPIAPWQRASLIAVVMALFAVSTFSHQLTPFATVACVIALVMFNRCSARGLPVFMLIVLATWISFMAAPYLAGHVNSLLSDIGSVNGAMTANLTSRFHGSAQHAFIVHFRLGFTAVVWGLAVLGAVRRLRRGVPDLPFILLALAPFPLIGLQSYGGEMLLRVYLFTLPAMGFFMAALFYTKSVRAKPIWGASWLRPVVISLTSLLLLGGFFFARYGNERMDYIAVADVKAVQYLYDIAKPGAVLVALSPDLPWQTKDLEQYKYRTVTDLHPTEQQGLLEHGSINSVLQLMRQSSRRPTYLIITPSQKAAMEVFSGFPASLVDRLQRELVTSKSTRVIYNRDGAQIIMLKRTQAPIRRAR